MNKQIQWQNVVINKTITVEDYCAQLYRNFDNIKHQFLLCFNSETNKVNFDKFIPKIQSDLNIITNYICFNIFNNDKELWNLSNTYDWLLRCFDKYKSNKEMHLGYIIQLYYKQKFEKYFCACCKKTLRNLICKKFQYMNAKKRKCNGIISINNEDNKMKELEDLKDYIKEINDYQDYLKFSNVLTKNEIKIFLTVLVILYEHQSQFKQDDLTKQLQLSNSTVSRGIKSIQKKWQIYKYK